MGELACIAGRYMEKGTVRHSGARSSRNASWSGANTASRSTWITFDVM